MKRQFVVIGLGNFGATLAKSLTSKGAQVLAIDMNKDRVQDLKDDVSEAIVMDARDREAMLSLPIQETDIAIISLGDEMLVSILATLFLRELGVKEIMAKAINSEHEKILKLIGATDVIFPEQEMALRLADKLAHPTVLDYVPLAEGFSMVEIKPAKSFYGKTLSQLDIRKNYGFEVVVIKTITTNKDGSEVEKIKSIPTADYMIAHGDILVVIGEDKYIDKYKKLD